MTYEGHKAMDRALAALCDLHRWYSMHPSERARFVFAKYAGIKPNIMPALNSMKEQQRELQDELTYGITHLAEKEYDEEYAKRKLEFGLDD